MPHYKQLNFPHDSTSEGMERGTPLTCELPVKHKKEKLSHAKPKTMPGCVIPLSVANRATDAGNNFMNPNLPDVTRMSKRVVNGIGR